MNTPIRLLYILFFFGSMGLSRIAVSQAIKDVYAHTIAGNDAYVNVLADHPNLVLDKIVLTNHGTAKVRNNQIVFTPAAGFSGVAYVNYTACDAKGQNCLTGLATIDVAEPIQPFRQLSHLFVKHNDNATFTLPQGYQFVPENSALNGGTLVETSEGSGIWQFTPSPQLTDAHTAEAYFYRYYNNRFSQFEVRFLVLKAPRLKFYTRDDYAATRVGKPVSLNVLNNDKKDMINRVVIQTGDNTYGTVQDNGNGLITFTPKDNFKGIAVINYQVFTNDNKTDDGKVFITVSYFNPDVVEDIVIQASRGVPTVFPYRVPVDGFYFETLNDRSEEGGTVKFYEQFEGKILNQDVKVKNAIIYTSSRNTDLDYDEFYVGYTIKENNEGFPWQRVVVKINDIPNPCVTDCIWPGDANNDGVVDLRDVHTISRNLGVYGSARGGATEWLGQNAPDWQDSDNNTNLKYADTNGDGIISEKDVAVIVENFHKKSTLIPHQIVPDTDIPLYLPSVNSQFGNMVEIPITIGSVDYPVFDALGLSFDIHYAGDFFKSGSVQMDFDKAGWLSRFDSYLSINKETANGKVIAALSRTKERGASGHGEVGKLRGVVVDDINGFRLKNNATINVRLTNITLLKKDGQTLRLPDAETTINLSRQDNKNEVLQNDDLKMYPNPASDAVNFFLNGINRIDYIRLMDVTGREVSRINNVNGKEAVIQTGALARGLYLAEVMTDKGRIVKKLQLTK